MARRNMRNENEMEVLQSLALLELGVMCNAKSRISKSGDVLSVQEQAASKIGNTNAMRGRYLCISRDVPKWGKGEHVIGRTELVAERNKRLEGWSRNE